MVLFLSYVQRLLCGLASYLTYSGCCVVMLLSYVQRLLCGIAHCLYPVYCACCVVLLLSYVQRLLWGISRILFTVLAAWFRFYLMYSGCCVALALAAWLGPFPVYSSPFVWACGVACPLSCLALMLFTALTVRLGSYAVYSACCVILARL